MDRTQPYLSFILLFLLPPFFLPSYFSIGVQQNFIDKYCNFFCSKQRLTFFIFLQEARLGNRSALLVTPIPLIYAISCGGDATCVALWLMLAPVR